MSDERVSVRHGGHAADQIEVVYDLDAVFDLERAKGKDEPKAPF